MRSRRELLHATAASVGALVIVGCKSGGAQDTDQEGDVTASEDLMREHGVVRRLLGVLEACAARFDQGARPFEALAGATEVIRRFGEDYHQQLEEQYLFPRFQRNALHAELVDTLVIQHRVGRAQTDELIACAKARLADAPTRDRARRAIAAFAQMYRPHAAREDTVLFPDLHKVATRGELDELADVLEREERHRFGPHGYHDIVEQVAELERGLGIYELARFTPVSS
ncbi:MAG: hemerythrin domain-containing protein [Acidobacteriota bacterium]